MKSTVRNLICPNCTQPLFSVFRHEDGSATLKDFQSIIEKRPDGLFAHCKNCKLVTPVGDMLEGLIR